MPLLYGEGQKAFSRLQEEILRSSYDYSLFAWGLDLNSISDLEALVAAERKNPSLKFSSRHAIGRPYLRGLLANSPAEFDGSHDVEPSQWADRIHASQVPPVIHNRCVHIDFLVIDDKEDDHDPDQNLKLSVAVLGCHPKPRSGDYLGLVFQSWGNGVYSGRLKEPVLVPPRFVENPHLLVDDHFRISTIRVRIKEEPLEESLSGCFVIRNLLSKADCQLGKVVCVPGARYDRRSQVLWPSPGRVGPQALFTFSLVGIGDRFGIVVARGTGYHGSPAWACVSKLSGRASSFEDQLLTRGTDDLYTWPKTQSTMQSLMFRISDSMEIEVKLRNSSTRHEVEDLFISLHATTPSAKLSTTNQLSKPDINTFKRR
jgi:hypothetical protein